MVFERQKQTVIRMVKRYGQACTWRKPSAASGGTAALPAGTVYTDYPCTIVFLNHKRESLASTLAALVGSVDIPTGGMLGIMAPDIGFEPELKDLIIRSAYPIVTGERLTIADKNGIEVLAPNHEGALLYKIRLVR